MGSTFKKTDDLQILGQSPLPGHWKLIQNGKLIHETDGVTLDYPVKDAGNYRAELWLKVAGEDRIWILTNPLYVTEK